MIVWIKVECTEGVLGRLSYPMQYAFQWLCTYWAEDVYVVAITGGEHQTLIKHYFANAIDVLPPKEDAERKTNRLKELLGDDFQVLWEGEERIHIEYSPKDFKVLFRL